MTRLELVPRAHEYQLPAACGRRSRGVFFMNPHVCLCGRQTISHYRVSGTNDELPYQARGLICGIWVRPEVNVFVDECEAR
jgi:hypothetical protein